MENSTTVLTEPEMEVLRTVLQTAPRLQAFCLVAGELGLDGALEACDSHVLGLAATHRFIECNFTVRDLPSRQVMEGVILGARVYARQRQGSHRKKRPLRDVAKEWLTGQA